MSSKHTRKKRLLPVGPLPPQVAWLDCISMDVTPITANPRTSCRRVDYLLTVKCQSRDPSEVSTWHLLLPQVAVGGQLAVPGGGQTQEDADAQFGYDPQLPPEQNQPRLSAGHAGRRKGAAGVRGGRAAGPTRTDTRVASTTAAEVAGRRRGAAGGLGQLGRDGVERRGGSGELRALREPAGRPSSEGQ
ncbi:hypothetical protein ON010_g16505 [Phytophthora cinnamomi]|nr:hypothetical protein ON010_g16505 [Phytophthora cinnamomi]